MIIVSFILEPELIELCSESVGTAEVAIIFPNVPW